MLSHQHYNLTMMKSREQGVIILGRIFFAGCKIVVIDARPLSKEGRRGGHSVQGYSEAADIPSFRHRFEGEHARPRLCHQYAASVVGPGMQ
jgi:hypothetical protein